MVWHIVKILLEDARPKRSKSVDMVVVVAICFKVFSGGR